MVDIFKILTTSFLSHPDITRSIKDREISELPTVNLGTEVTNLQPELATLFTNIQINYNKTTSSPTIVTKPALGAWVGHANGVPKIPMEDSFYFPDVSKYVKLTNGDVIDYREIGVPGISNIKKAYQISYRTESTFGDPRADLTTLIIPNNYDNKHVVSVQSYLDAAALQCSPSYQLLSGFRDDSVDEFLKKGWAVNFPDHQGVFSAAFVGQKNGKSTLDSLRAVKNIQKKIGFSLDKIGLYGYSGGSIATGHAAEIQPKYAPDVNITAAAVGGFIVNQVASLVTINRGPYAGFGLVGFFGMAAEYPEFNTTLHKFLKPELKELAMKSTQNCAAWDLVNYLGKDVFDFLSNGIDFFGESPIFDAYTNEILGNFPPPFPMFVHQGAMDEVAPAAQVDEAVEQYCRGGSAIYYQRDLELDHIQESQAGFPNAVKFLERFFNGEKPVKCGSFIESILQTAGKKLEDYIPKN